ncbi:glycoside hydrolase family 9 protein [Pontibacter akesuensis]|uniref:Endoglucanase n=1 Tax=Pontibacter akesuensis TaxID=388950 RepID=A0A1I7KXI8_9BACT|nr:glycoside hydrolase family 9 protein [Pontibacter akesuensis]GHA78520.1 endoglucanase [Pontibacter akesuensis]SFV02137.1 non-processive endocellulase [Pontibacter akesuensis]
MKHIKSGLFALLTGVLACAGLSASGQQQSQEIRLNQIGFYPDGAKKAIVPGKVNGSFYITTANLTDTLYTGKLGEELKSLHSAKTTRVADFSPLKAVGTYVLVVPGLGHSYPFAIGQEVYRDVAHAAIKAFYFQRASTDLGKEHAGQWSRPGGHPDNKVLVHASAASKGRPAETIISSTKGWYDAGDYNKYIVNSGITTATMLSAYEDFPAYFNTLHLQLPESNNTLPDLLDESLWNLRWMLTMQDPEDGGVYHKLTTPEFEGMSTKPSEANAPRYVVKKSTAAALNFAAVMAQASRVFSKYEKELPGFADSSLVAAKAAWQWARKNPTVLYDQPAMNKQFNPDVNTGAYDDNDVSDEFDWAAAELYLTTKDEVYYKAIKAVPHKNMELPSWGQVRLLGYYSLARHQQDLTPAARKDFPKLKAALVAFADQLVKAGEKTSYKVPMGGKASDFVWGSNAVAGNQGIALVQAYRLTKDQRYLNSALANLDYLLGRNATGYSFLTGFGSKTPMFPHHRLSVSDEVKEPVPGLLVGGPNPGQQDGCTYHTKIADESYIDEECSYAANEIAINWNAPFVYLASALEAMKHEAGYVQTKNK